MTNSSIGRMPHTVRKRDHARTAAAAILDALLPIRQRHRYRQQSLEHHPFAPYSSTSPASSLPHIMGADTSFTPQYAPLQRATPPPHTLSCTASVRRYSRNSEIITPSNAVAGQTVLNASPAFDTPAFDASPSSFCIRRIGHASVLINLFGTIILTDPVLSDCVGIELLGRTIGISRYTMPSLNFSAIPKPDLILLSHAHFDHTDLPTLRRFAGAYPEEIELVCAKNTADIVDNLSWKNVIEADWDEEMTICGVRICALKAVHNGWRYPWERDRASGYTTTGRSYNAYLIAKHGKTVIFGGDTAYTEHFESLRHENIDVAIMPIGAYQDYESLHCTPEQALQMATAMEAQCFVPIHFGAFYQSNEAPQEPLQRLIAASSEYTPVLASGIDFTSEQTRIALPL